MFPVSMYQNIRYMLMLLLKSNYFSLYDFDRRFSIDDNLQHCSVSYCLLWFYSFNYITVTWQHKFSIMPAYFLQCPILVWVMIHTFTCFVVSRDRKERFHRGSILRLLYRDRGSLSLRFLANSLARERATSPANPGRRIGRADGPDRAFPGHFVKKPSNLREINPRSKFLS